MQPLFVALSDNGIPIPNVLMRVYFEVLNNSKKPGRKFKSDLARRGEAEVVCLCYKLAPARGKTKALVYAGKLIGQGSNDSLKEIRKLLKYQNIMQRIELLLTGYDLNEIPLPRNKQAALSLIRIMESHLREQPKS